CTWFTLSLSIFCLLFFHCSRAHRDLHSFPTRRSSDLALVVAELAAAVMLLSGAGLLIRSFWNLQHVSPGFQPEGVLKAEYQLPGSRYPADRRVWPQAPAHYAFARAILNKAASLPGVTNAALANVHPLDPG